MKDGTQIREIVIDIQDREIEVSVLDDQQITIDYSQSGRNFYEISVSEYQVLTMTAADSKDFADYIASKPPAENRKISLRIPDSLLFSLTRSATNENIVLSALAVKGSASVTANGGYITFKQLQAIFFPFGRKTEISPARSPGTMRTIPLSAK